jgi:hypothetical protein
MSENNTPISAAQFRLLDRYTKQELARIERKREKMIKAAELFDSINVEYDMARFHTELNFLDIEIKIAMELKDKVEGKL